MCPEPVGAFFKHFPDLCKVALEMPKLFREPVKVRWRARKCGDKGGRWKVGQDVCNFRRYKFVTKLLLRLESDCVGCLKERRRHT